MINYSITKAVRKDAQWQYSEINQELRRYTTRGKRKLNDELAKEAETAAEQHITGDLYNLTKKLSGKKSSVSKPIKYNH